MPVEIPKDSIKANPRHDPLLRINIVLKGIPVVALIDSGASAPVISPTLANKLEWREKEPTCMAQADGTILEARRVVSARFYLADLDLPQPFNIDAEVIDIGNHDLILGLSWLREHGFTINPIA